MSPDQILAFLFDHPILVFGTVIGIGVAVLVLVGKPKRVRGWLLDIASVAVIGVAAAALWMVLSIAGALDRRLASLKLYVPGDPSPHTLSEYRGKVVFLNYWATWCGPCRHEIPEINRLVAHWQGKDIVFLAITDEDEAVIEKFRAKVPMAATVARFTSAPPTTSIEKAAYDGRPSTLLIDREGRVRKRIIGPRDYAGFQAAVAPLM